MKNQRITPWACILPIALAVGLTACGGGGGGGSSSTGSNEVSKGYTLPSEISAVPTDDSQGNNSAGLVKGFGSAINQLSKAATASGLPATSDYATTKGRVFVEEPTLEQFDIIEQVLNALGQTNYADEVGNGPYQAVIAWEEDNDGKAIKQLQTWTVESTMVAGNHPVTDAAQQVNIAQAWIPERDPRSGEERTIKAQFEIYTSAQVAADGSFINYGEWDLNVYFDANPDGADTDNPQGFFAAEARLDADGVTTLKVVDRGIRDMGLIEEMRGVLVRSQDAGHGVVSYPDHEACYMDSASGASGGGGGGGDTCTTAFPTKEAKYAYDATHLVVQNESEDPIYKDRNLDGAIKIVHRYGLFFADADTTNGYEEGGNVEKELSFGFPVRFDMTALENSGVTFENWAYYGAWQGRHELWGPEQGIVVDNGSNGPSGTNEATVFTRADLPPNQTAPQYTMVEFDGTFTMRGLVDANLEDIKNIPVEVYIDKHFDLFYMADGWYSCAGWINWWEFDENNGSANPANACLDENGDPLTFTPFAGNTELQTELAQGNTQRSWINIGFEDKTDPENPVFMDMVFLNTADGNDANYTVPGFYEAEWGEKGLQAMDGAAVLTPADGMQLWVSIGGSIYVSYVGFDNPPAGITTGWAQKILEGFDDRTWQPVFAQSGDVEFVPDRGREYYMHNNGQNYVVRRIGVETNSEDDYSAKVELQTTANPANTDSADSLTLLPAGTDYLASPWDLDVKYTFQEDPENDNYLLLTVLHDARGELEVGSVASNDSWGLVAYTDGGTTSDYSDDQPLAADGTALIVDDWGWIDPAANSNKEAMQFTWEYAGGDDGNTWGKQRFLKNVADNEIEILSDPILLEGVPLFDSIGNQVKVDPENSASDNKLINTQFDGWMHGLPDMYHVLWQNDWEITPEIAGKVVHIQEGTRVEDTEGNFYFVKPLDTSLFLGVVNEADVSASLTLTDANNINFDAVGFMPTYEAHNMGAVPEGTAVTVKYSEGKAVE